MSWKGSRCYLSLVAAALALSGIGGAMRQAWARHTAGNSLAKVGIPHAKTSIIWDDDCGSDVDCIYSLEAIHRQLDRGRIEVLAFILNSPNPYGGPVLHAWSTLWDHASIPIGVYKGKTGTEGSASNWSRAVRDAFRPGDVSSRYADCVTVYRRALAKAADHSVRLIETGFPTCLVALMKSPADTVSHYTGSQLLRKKVEALFVMGGDYPGPATEYNFKSAPAESSYLFKHWTREAGYPPVYLNGFTPGLAVTLGVNRPTPAGSAIEVAQKASGETARPAWDIMSLHQGMIGTAAYVISSSGANKVSATSGTNIWSPHDGPGTFILPQPGKD